MHPFSFTTTAQILCESGASLKLAELCHERGARRVLIVTDPGITRLGLLDPLLPGFARAGMDVRVFDQVLADPPEAVVLAAVAQAREQQAELVIGFGGGSSMDVAKLVALLGHPDCEQALAQIYGVGNARGRRLPLIQIPTTAGTGSEVTPIAIVTTGETTKMGVVSPLLLPDLALLDADLTLGLPPTVTAATGIDAMVHAIEAFVSTGNGPLTDPHALEAMRLINGNLVEMIANPHDIALREKIMLGSMQAGLAFSNAILGAVHAMSHSLGGFLDLPHGLCNAVLVEHVVAFNYSAAPERFKVIAETLGIDCRGLNHAQIRQRLVEHLIAFKHAVGFRETLGLHGVGTSDIPFLSSHAMDDPCILTNPRESTQRDVEVVYGEAL